MAEDEMIERVAAAIAGEVSTHDLVWSDMQRIARVVLNDVFDWQPIKTAPKDGSPILTFNSRHSAPPVVVRWTEENLYEGIEHEPHWCDAATRDGTALYYNGRYFDYWMPLPQPPK